MILSLKMPTYDEQPEMSVQGAADKVVELVNRVGHELTMCNLALPNMVRDLPCRALNYFWS